MAKLSAYHGWRMEGLSMWRCSTNGMSLILYSIMLHTHPCMMYLQLRRSVSCVPRGGVEDESAVVLVQVVGKVGASGPAMPGFPEHGVSAEVLKPGFGIGEEGDGGVFG